MCLSTVYKNQVSPQDIVMKNVMRVECKDGCVILTDLMERQVAIEGQLQEANLVDGFVIVRECPAGNGLAIPQRPQTDLPASGGESQKAFRQTAV